MTSAIRAWRADPGGEGEAATAAPPLLESELDYLARRPRQERELAAQATNSSAAMAHMFLAAAFANRIVEQTASPAEFEELLGQLD